jgi:hypothetical protein
MEYKTLGNTGLLVSRLCFGTMTIAGDNETALSENGAIWKSIGNVGQAGSDELVKTSFNAGINFFDTADVYSEGRSEAALGQSFKNLSIASKDVVIARSATISTGTISSRGPGCAMRLRHASSVCTLSPRIAQNSLRRRPLCSNSDTTRATSARLRRRNDGTTPFESIPTLQHNEKTNGRMGLPEWIQLKGTGINGGRRNGARSRSIDILVWNP